MTSKGRLKLVLVRIGMVAASLMVSLVLVEVTLRLFLRKYDYAASPALNFDSLLIWSTKPDSAIERIHPDNGDKHVVYHNNHGLRQGRDVAEAELRTNRVIAVYGDSFTANTRMDGPFVFTEVLDYLLNFDGESSRPNTTVLNYGVDGYGTDQCYLRYASLGEPRDPEQVFYVFCNNDIKDIYANNLLALKDGVLQVDEGGTLRSVRPPEPGILIRFLSRLYLTYFVRESIGSILNPEAGPDRDGGGEGNGDNGNPAESPAADDLTEERLRARYARENEAGAEDLQRLIRSGRFEDAAAHVDLFVAILEVWRKQVESRGGRFCIILLPNTVATMPGYLSEKGFEVLDLRTKFEGSVPDYKYKKIRFRNDGHWNELGNMYAAMGMYDYLSAEPASFSAVEDRLSKYYSCFDRSFVGMPERAELDPEVRAQIRARYLELANRK